MNKLSAIFWWLYIAVSPVYWVPLIGVATFSFFKIFLIAVAAITASLTLITEKRITLPFGYLGMFGFFILCFSFLPGVIGGTPGAGYKMLLNVFYSFTTFIAIALLYQKNQRLVEHLSYTGFIIGALCFYVVLAGQGVVENYRPPINLGGFPVSFSGFTGLRTGWSNGTAFFIPFLIYLAFHKKSYMIKALCIACICSIFLSQVTVAGRNGMLASVLGAFLMLYFMKKRLLLMLFGFVILVLALVYLPLLLEHLRFDRIESSASVDDFNKFSAGRLESYYYALSIILKNPVFGVGFGNTDIAGHSIHNMVLRYTAETGIIFLFVFLGLVAAGLYKLYPFRNNPAACVPMVVIIQGVLESQFEPGVLLGSFQNSALWWACVGIAGAISVKPSLGHIK